MDIELVRELLRRQHPDFADYEIRESTAGFDNTIWRLGDDFGRLGPFCFGVAVGPCASPRAALGGGVRSS